MTARASSPSALWVEGWRVEGWRVEGWRVEGWRVESGSRLSSRAFHESDF